MIDRRVILAVVAVLLLGGAWWWFRPQDRPLRNVPPPSNLVVVFGDSLAMGFGAAPGKDIASRLHERFGVKVSNLGQSGDTTTEALHRLPQVLAMKPGLVVVIVGGNDMILGTRKEEVLANVRQLLTRLLDAGAAVCFVGVQPPVMTGISFRSEFAALARELEVAYVPDALAGILDRPGLKVDAIHPNSEGYGVLAEKIARAIEPIVMKMP